VPHAFARADVTAPGRLARLSVAPLFVGVFAAVAASAMADQPLKILFYRVAALALVGVALRSPHPRRVLLFFWTVTLTYNRNYFIEALGNHGSYGLYWSPADVFLAALLGLWAFDAAVNKRAPVARGPRLWPWFLPFAAGCVLSIFGAAHVEWTAFELTRVLRVALILCYFRYNVRREDWWACIAGFACAILVQSAISVQYVATGRRFGVTSVLGLTPGAEQLQAAVAGAQDTLGFRRGEGTLGHPNTLAIYFLLTGPLFGALALAARDRRVRWLAAAVGLAALAGVASTLSRTSWVITLGEMLLLCGLLLACARLRVRRVAGLAVVGAFLGAIALAPLAPQIQRRFFSNFRESLDFRTNHGTIAIDIWSRSPLVGVGLNNYSNTLAEYDLPEVEIFLELGELARTALGIRSTAWVHNIYLLILGETGLIGLAGFIVFLAGAFLLALRGVARTSGDVQLVSIGLAVGMVGVYLHGIQESALWIDPVLYSFAAAIGLAALAVDCHARSADAPASLRELAGTPAAAVPSTEAHR